jgi:indole-3-glycerol phosphate synthase/phosphoribosylanthranilate isomerase
LRILEQIIAHKQQEINTLEAQEVDLPRRDFFSAATRSGFNLIAELKKRSPSNPQIINGKFDVPKLASELEQGGAQALSVLTDKRFFGGSFNYLAEAKKATSLPILAKDFFISKRQITLAKKAGADAILLIARILTNEKLEELYNFADKLRLTVLLEIANEEDLEKALKTKARLIGINNRDLDTFKLDLKTTFKLAKLLKNQAEQTGFERKIITLSGFKGSDVQLVKQLTSGVLVGTEIMQAADKKAKIQEFTRPKPLLKICGLRDETIATELAELDVDLIGLNFAPTSRRHIPLLKAEKIKALLNPQQKLVGIFLDPELSVVSRIARHLDLDFIQIHGTTSSKLEFPQTAASPLIQAQSVKSLASLAELMPTGDLLLFDGADPGSGTSFDHQLLTAENTLKPFFIAGGVNHKNAREIISKFQADPNFIGLDTASGAEKNGQMSLEAIEKLVEAVKG